MADTPTSAPAEALAVLQRFLDASLRHDVETMRGCLSRATLESGNFNDAGQEGVRYELGEAAPEGAAWVVPVKALAVDAPADAPPAMTLPAILIQEDGAWKFDLAASMERLMGGAMQQAMQQVGDAMGQAMEGVGKALAAAFGESGASGTNWLEADTGYAPEELWALPPMAPLPKLEAALDAICRHPVTAGVALSDLLRQLGSDDANTLMNWFEDSIFAGWVSMVALLANRYPTIRRLQGMRVEAAKEPEQRMLILDGSDLVYRMYLNDTAGYYSDAELNEILPGVLAGLPETADSSLRGFRSIHTDEEPADLEAFKTRTVPRWMRRICELLGKNITLEANWDDVYNPTVDTRQLVRWSLNRIYGALCLACTYGRRKEALGAEMTAIKIALVSNIVDRAAEYSGGVLAVSLNYFPGETGCFYEKDLVRVLGGEVTKYVDPSGGAEGAATGDGASSVAAADAAAPDSPESEERYAQAAAFMTRLEAVMKANKLWPGDKPAGDIEVRGAFGCENMAFTQWLAWVLVPRVKETIAERGSFPPKSQVSTYAVREFDGVDDAAEVIEVLSAFDEMINTRE